MSTNLGDKIKALRKDKGLSLEALSLEAGMSKSYLWELENRATLKPSAEKLASLALALDMPVSYFIEEDVITPEERHMDHVFFRNYGKLEAPEKEQLHAILKTFLKPK